MVVVFQEIVATLGITVTEEVLLGISQVCPSGNINS